MATEGPGYGSYTTPEGVRRSARIKALNTAIDNRNAEEVVEITLQDGLDAAGFVEDSGGSRQRMRGGMLPKTNEAIAELHAKVLTAEGDFKAGVDEKIAAIIKAIPSSIPKVATGALVTGLVKYPTVFANIVKVVADVVPIPTGANWTAYTEAGSTIASAFTGLFGKAVSATIAGPLVPVLIGLYIQKRRAGDRGLKAQFIQDAEYVKSKASNLATAQAAAFEKAWKETRDVQGPADLKVIASKLKMERTPGVSGITGVGPTDPAIEGLLKPTGDPFREPGKPIETLSGKKRSRTAALGDTTQASKVQKTGEGAIGSTSVVPSGDASVMEDSVLPSSSASTSSSSASSPGTGGRRRKTRGKKMRRRVTRRIRRFAY
jgi:hypothetical protein